MISFNYSRTQLSELQLSDVPYYPNNTEKVKFISDELNDDEIVELVNSRDQISGFDNLRIHRSPAEKMHHKEGLNALED